MKIMFLVCRHRGVETLFGGSHSFFECLPLPRYGARVRRLLVGNSIYEVSHEIALLPISSPSLGLLLPQSSNRLVSQCIQHRHVWDPLG